MLKVRALLLTLLLSACQTPLNTPLQQLESNQALNHKGAFQIKVEDSQFGTELTNVFQEMADRLSKQLNETYRLPEKDIKVVFQDCGSPDAFYTPNTQTIVMCSELFLLLGQKFSLSDSQDVFRFVFWHELSHAFIDQFDLPILGKEEDAADAMATVMLLEKDNDSRTALLAAINFYDLYRSGFSSSWSDSHSIGPQRMFNLVCWSAGGAPEVLSSPLIQALYDEAQSSDRNCKAEYAQQQSAVDFFLAPYQLKP